MIEGIGEANPAKLSHKAKCHKIDINEAIIRT